MARSSAHSNVNDTGISYVCYPDKLQLAGPVTLPLTAAREKGV